MLITMSAADISSERSGLELWPSAEIPSSRRTVSVVLGISPNGTSPALDGSITSDALCLAMASAIWLRHALPMHRNKTLVRGTIIFFPGWDSDTTQNDTESTGAQAGVRPMLSRK